MNVTAAKAILDGLPPKKLCKLYGNPSGYKPDDKAIKNTSGEFPRAMTSIEFIKEVSNSDEETSLQDFVSKITNGSTTTSGKELLSTEYPSMTYLAGGFIPTGTTLFCGDPKVGKSLVALQFASCISDGSNLFERFPCSTTGKTLYYCLEDGARRVNRRLKELGIDDDAASEILFRWDVPELGAGLEELLEYDIRSTEGIRLVVIDPLVKIRAATGSKNPYREDYKAIQAVRTILERFGVSGLIVHHTRKELQGDDSSPLARVSGTQGLAGAADHIFVMSKIRGSQGATISRTSRDADEMEVALQLDGVRWQYAGDGGIAKLTPAQYEVYEAIATSPAPIGTTEIAAAIDKAKSTVSGHAEKLEASGFIVKIGTKYGKAA